MLYKIRCNPMDSLYCALSVTYCMSQCLLHLVLWPYIGNHLPLLDAEPRSTAGLSFPSQFLNWTILLTLYLVVYHWPVLRVGPFHPFPFHPFLVFFPWVDIVRLGFLDLCGVNRSLSGFQCRPLLIIILIIENNSNVRSNNWNKRTH